MPPRSAKSTGSRPSAAPSSSRTTISAPRYSRSPILSAIRWNSRTRRARSATPRSSCFAASTSWPRPPRSSIPSGWCCCRTCGPDARWRRASPPRRWPSARPSCARFIPTSRSSRTSTARPTLRPSPTPAALRPTRLKVVEAIDSEHVLFVPDQNLANYVQSQTSKKIISWDGNCYVHHQITAEEVDAGQALDSRNQGAGPSRMPHRRAARWPTRCSRPRDGAYAKEQRRRQVSDRDRVRTFGSAADGDSRTSTSTRRASSAAT